MKTTIDLRKAAYYSPKAGENITSTLSNMLGRANILNIRVACVFNNQQIIVSPGMTLEEALESWQSENDQKFEKWANSFKGALYRRDQERRSADNAHRKREINQMLAEESIEIPWYKRFGWNKAVRINKDPYGAAVIRYATAWAVAMQRAMRDGKKIADVSDELSHYVDFEGITGFQYHAAKALLRYCWKYRSLLPK